MMSRVKRMTRNKPKRTKTNQRIRRKMTQIYCYLDLLMEPIVMPCSWTGSTPCIRPTSSRTILRPQCRWDQRQRRFLLREIRRRRTKRDLRRKQQDDRTSSSSEIALQQIMIGLKTIWLISRKNCKCLLLMKSRTTLISLMTSLPKEIMLLIMLSLLKISNYRQQRENLKENN